MKDAIVIKVKDIGEAKSIEVETDLEVTGAECVLIIDALMRSLHMPFDLTETEGLAKFGATLRLLKQYSSQKEVEIPGGALDILRNFLKRGSDE